MQKEWDLHLHYYTKLYKIPEKKSDECDMSIYLYLKYEKKVYIFFKKKGKIKGIGQKKWVLKHLLL